ncbi:alpha/beta fold hydrolase [Flagellimonas nanhaiensis]|uniref:Alpha/beta hydrolase n=1 Tax=Flagellimonas nanhaiensis TaxID=2292706 RepID=A0A371JSG9_9FLAO|nr:alpha/beta hydrolase [Allomuricauda nanhaiensis]RDY60758.1 alpha/beta hydrolase [Allomuricauda nanhaiensis]
MIYVTIVFLLMVFAIGGQIQRDIPLEKLTGPFSDEDSKFFLWNGVQIHYKDEGKGEPIVLLHGSSSSLHTWDGLTKMLKSDFRIVRVDLIGFGLTGPNPKQDYSLEMYMDFINSFADHLGLPSFTIVGNSWGGMLAWNFAAQNPQRISSMVLINSAGLKMKTVPTRFKLVKTSMGRWILKNTMSKWMVKKGIKEVYHQPSKIDSELVERYQSLTLREGNRKAFVDIVLARKLPDINKLLKINVPTLILWGRYDLLYPLKQARRFKELLAKSQLKIIENTGHVPMEEAPLACGREIKTFIKSLQ